MRLTLILAWIALFAIAGCGGGSGSTSPIASRSIITSVGETIDLRGLIPNASTLGLLWRVKDDNGGMITPQGVYTAPTKPGSYDVYVTSSQNSDIQATLTLVVESGGTTVMVPFPGTGDTGTSVTFPNTGDVPVIVK